MGFDLLLVVGYFRSATPFLALVRHLSGQYRIGVVFVPLEPSIKAKTGEAHELFKQLCKQFGAEVVPLGEPVRTRVMVVQQYVYSDAVAARLKASVQTDSTVGMMTLASAGLAQHDRFIEQFGITKAYAPDAALSHFLLEHRSAAARYAGVEIAEVGLPFQRYPVFPQFEVDWIFVAPTLFSFHSEAGKQQFLLTVNQLLDQIPSDDVVVYKSHNGNSLDYFAPRIHHQLAGLLAKVSCAQRLMRYLKVLPWSWLRLQIERVQSCVLHRAILNRAIPMFRLTPYAGISLEAFLPGVRKGVLGGLSNAIWGTLYFNLPYYNCVDDSLRPGKSELLDKQSDTLLDLNLQYFGVPFCGGDLGMDTRKQAIVQPHERAGNLVAAIMVDLALVRAAHSDVA